MAAMSYEVKIDEMHQALMGSPLPGSAPGLLQRMSEGERDRLELRRQLGDLALAVRTLEATPGKTAIGWWDRIGLLLVGMCLSALGAILSRSMQGSTP